MFIGNIIAYEKLYLTFMGLAFPLSNLVNWNILFSIDSVFVR